jgi:hypothetical protein
MRNDQERYDCGHRIDEQLMAVRPPEAGPQRRPDEDNQECKPNEYEDPTTSALFAAIYGNSTSYDHAAA